MSTPTPEVLQGKVEALKKKLAEKGESLQGPQLRALKKKIRRAQRRRRLMLEGQAKAAPAKTAEPAAEKPAEKTEDKAQEPAAEKEKKE
jgi:hypothetical protein